MEEFEARFLTHSENNNKPSQLYAKKGILRNHLKDVFGKVKLDEIGAEAVEDYKAAKVKEGLAPKTINNHLAILDPRLGKVLARSMLLAT